MNCLPILKEFARKTSTFKDYAVLALGPTLKVNCLDANLIEVPPMRPFPDLAAFPHTPGDFFVHIKTKKVDETFDISYAFTNIVSLEKMVESIEYSEVIGFSYRVGGNKLGRDLSGFEDGTENPPPIERRQHAFTVNGTSFLLTQKWAHDLKTWNKFTVNEQEKIIGRTKVDSIELNPLPPASHVERTEHTAKMVRHSVPFGDSKLNGLFFIAYVKDLHTFHHTLRMMGGAYNNVHDKIIKNLSNAVTGAYWYVPNFDMIRLWASK